MMKIKDIEFTWSEVNKKYQLVRWYSPNGNSFFKDPSSCVIAFFDEHKEGYDLRTVGERFFVNDEDLQQTIVVLAKHALRFLNGIHSKLPKDS